MPKISKRRQPRHGQAQRIPRSGTGAIQLQARKVSFEEGSSVSSSSSSSPCLKSSSSGALIPRTSPCSNMHLMNALLERTPTPAPCECHEQQQTSVSSTERPLDDYTSSCPLPSSSSPWGQFVDVIPHDDSDDNTKWSDEDGGCCGHQWWDDPSSYASPNGFMLSHSSPAYHPYSNHSNTNSARKSSSSTKVSMVGLPSIPNKTSVTRKLQPKRQSSLSSTNVDIMEGAFEQLRF